MAIQVDPGKVDELSAEFKRLSRTIADAEISVNKEIASMINETNGQYNESYVRAATSQMEGLLKEIRGLAASISERLQDKSRVLHQAAERYRSDEETARKKKPKSSNFSFFTATGSAAAGFFQSVGNVVSSAVSHVLGFILGKGKNRYNGPAIHLSLDVPPLKSKLSLSPKVYSEEVKRLQQRLRDLGYDIEADGYFNAQTLAAVSSYKNKYGLGNTGEHAGLVGEQTWLCLFGALSGQLSIQSKGYRMKYGWRKSGCRTWDTRLKSPAILIMLR